MSHRHAHWFHNCPTCTAYCLPRKYRLRLSTPEYPRLSFPHGSANASSCWSAPYSRSQTYPLPPPTVWWTYWKHWFRLPTSRYSRYLANSVGYSYPMNLAKLRTKLSTLHSPSELRPNAPLSSWISYRKPPVSFLYPGTTCPICYSPSVTAHTVS